MSRLRSLVLVPLLAALATARRVAWSLVGVTAPQTTAPDARAPLPPSSLTAAGELVGGLFFHNDPRGTRLTAGAVFGRRAGHTAAERAAAAG
jgi:tricarballylate dehydrogenase